MEPIVAVALSYLSGSIPFAAIAGKLRGVDLRKHGSGNLGATNVFRVLGWMRSSGMAMACRAWSVSTFRWNSRQTYSERNRYPMNITPKSRLAVLIAAATISSRLSTSNWAKSRFPRCSNSFTSCSSTRNCPITMIGAGPPRRSAWNAHSSATTVIRFATNRGSGRNRSVFTSHAFSRIPATDRIQIPGDCAARAKPLMPMTSSRYSEGLNWRMSYMDHIVGQRSGARGRRFLVLRHAVLKVDIGMELKPFPGLRAVGRDHHERATRSAGGHPRSTLAGREQHTTGR